MNNSDFGNRVAPCQGGDVPLRWHEPDTPPFRLVGFPWYEREKAYRRLPIAPAAKLPGEVDTLANCTAGGQIAFQSDSTRVAVRAALAGTATLSHMAPTGQCGFDLYVGPPFAQRFHDVSKYDQQEPAYEVLLFEHPDAQLRSFTLNFPLYQGVTRVQIGLVPEAHVEPALPWLAPGRIVIYGTSITQGGCASRPGMAYPSILSRALNMEIVNLGFSGAGRGEPEVIGIVAEVPAPQLLVLDYEANSVNQLHKTLPRAIGILRARHGQVPILVLSRIAYGGDATHGDSLKARERSRDMQARLVGDLRRKGDDRIHFLDGSALLGADFDECTVDGVHPNDLGFMRMARGLEPGIRSILEAVP